MQRPPELIFGVSGTRGIVGEGIDPITVCALGAAFGSYLGRGPVVVGRDSRLSGPVLSAALESGLMGVGCDVIRIGIVPTPTVQNMVRELGAAGGIAVTASHNPAEWNALKFVAGDGTFLTASAAEELFRRFDTDQFARARYDALGAARDDGTAIARHQARILALPILDRKAIAARKLKAVVDCVNGAGGLMLPSLLTQLGVEVLELNCEPTGRFARGPEPTRENLSALAARVRESGADLGYACDPDVDRLSLVTRAGEPLGEEMTLALAVAFVLERSGGGEVVTNVSTSMAIEEVAVRYGGRVHRTAVGEANVVEKIRAVKAVIGGEGNGGVIYPALGLARDASVGAALITQHLASGATLEELAARIPRFTILKSKLPLGKTDLEALGRALLAEAPGGTLDRTDGVKVRWPDRWVHLRSSNTEPIMRLIAEARSPAEAEALLDRTRALAGA